MGKRKPMRTFRLPEKLLGAVLEDDGQSPSSKLLYSSSCQAAENSADGGIKPKKAEFCTVDPLNRSPETNTV
jgi:hypothetical protein